MSAAANGTNSTAGPGLDMGALAKVITAKLDAYQYPVVYPYVPRLLIAFSAIYLLVFLISALIVIIPFFRGPKIRQKHMWLWRRVYSPSYSIPYYIPNGGIAVVISQIFGSIISQFYILFSYMGIKSREFASNHNAFFWLTISFSPGFFGGWYSCFSSLYITLFSPSRQGFGSLASRHYMPHPILMNIICVGVPILVAFGALGLGIVAIMRMRERKEAYDAVIIQLALGQDPTAGIARYAQSGANCLAQFKWASAYWSVVALITVLVRTRPSYFFHVSMQILCKFHFLAIFLLVPLLKKTVDLANGKISILGKLEQPIYSTEDEIPNNLNKKPQSPTSHTSLRAQKLHRAYCLLLFYFGTVGILMTWYCIIGVLMATSSAWAANDEAWRSVMIWVVVSTSILISGALLIQSWRVLSDRDETSSINCTRRLSEPGVPYGSSAGLPINYAPEDILPMKPDACATTRFQEEFEAVLIIDVSHE